MTMVSTQTLSTAAINLRRLAVVRNIVLAGQVVAVGVATMWLRMALPVFPIVFIFLAMAAVNALTWLRLRRPWPVRDLELFFHLTFDVFALTGFLYFTGGSTNPFTPLYLLPLALTAAALSWSYTWSMVSIAVACYTTLLMYYVPLPADHAGHVDAFRLHVFGMWLGFILSATLIAYFVVKMRETLRERDRLRAQMREQELRHERVLALGTLAAGAAHELGTPLSTIAVLINDLMRDSTGLPNKLNTLRAQVGRCKEILSSMSAAVGQARAEGGGAQALDAYLGNLIDAWRARRPEISVDVHMAGTSPAPRIVSEHTLGQALLNVLNNAADVSPREMELETRWTDSELTFEVRDRGPGISATVEEHAGEPFFSTKAPGEGMGLGLFLARGTIERLGGNVRLANRTDGGAVCFVQLPLGALRLVDA